MCSKLDLKHAHTPFVGFHKFTDEVETSDVKLILEVLKLISSVGLRVSFAENDLADENVSVKLNQEQLNHRSW